MRIAAGSLCGAGFGSGPAVFRGSGLGGDGFSGVSCGAPGGGDTGTGGATSAIRLSAGGFAGCGGCGSREACSVLLEAPPGGSGGAAAKEDPAAGDFDCFGKGSSAPGLTWGEDVWAKSSEERRPGAVGGGIGFAGRTAGRGGGFGCSRTSWIGIGVEIFTGGCGQPTMASRPSRCSSSDPMGAGEGRCRGGAGRGSTSTRMRSSRPGRTGSTHWGARASPGSRRRS